MANEYTAELVAAVKAHALANYNSGGWDYVVECWSDEEIIEAIGDNITEAGAIAAVEESIAPQAAMRDDVRGHGGCFDDEHVEFPRGEFPPQANVGPLA